MWPEIETTKNENKRELKLSGAAISERIDSNGLDHAIFDLTALNLLNISETSLKQIPAEISNLTNLQTILLFGNELIELPSTIGNLDKLKVLDVSRNKLIDIPIEINNLTNLSTINCSSNQLQSFPSLTNCTKLSTLDLSDNKLQEFPKICNDGLANLSEIFFQTNQIKEIPHNIIQLIALKHLNLSSNCIKTIPKNLATISKLKDLHLDDNPISDKRLLKLIQQCRTKQICDYVKQHGTDAPLPDKDDPTTTTAAAAGGKSKSNKQKKLESAPCRKIIVQRHTEQTLRLIFMDSVKEIRPYILCCVVKNLNFENGQFKKFLQIQTKLHETVCGKREKSTIATHDLAKLKGDVVRYTAHQPNHVKIIPLGKTKGISAQKLYDTLKAEAEALRKEKKRNVYSGIHKYLYLLDKKELFACLEDNDGNVISLPPLTNGDLTKISPETKTIFIEVTSSTSAGDCRDTMQELLHEMVLAGFGVYDAQGIDTNVEQQLIVQQVKITDLDGNLRTVYPSKTDLQYDETLNVVIDRE